jgi:hypothetical protein
MKACISLLLFLSSLSFSFSQGKISFKLYQNTDLFEISYSKYDYNLGKSFSGFLYNTNFNRISLAIQIRAKNKLMHELELMIPELSKPTNNPQFPFPYSFSYVNEQNYFVSTVSVRYEISKTLYSCGNFNLGMGIGINPYYIFGRFIPPVTNSFERTNKHIGFSFNITPRIAYKISNRFSIEVNSPFKVYDFIEATQHIDNPSIPIRQQTVTGVEHTFFQKVYTIRFGVSYSLK